MVLHYPPEEWRYPSVFLHEPIKRQTNGLIFIANRPMAVGMAVFAVISIYCLRQVVELPADAHGRYDQPRTVQGEADEYIKGSAWLIGPRTKEHFGIKFTIIVHKRHPYRHKRLLVVDATTDVTELADDQQHPRNDYDV